jgi:Fasciclin domain
MTYYRTNMSATTTLLLGHVVLDQVVSTRALDAGPVVLTSAAGDTLTFMSDFKDDGEPVYTVNDVEIVMTDVLANDGIVQVISSVLDVPRADPPEFSSDWPSSTPSQRPSITPSQRPSVTPSTTPSSIPSQAPSVAPSQEPSSHPVSLEVVRPTPRPTVGVVAPSPGPGKGSKSKKGGYNIR